MILLPHGCTCSKLNVFPKNWNTSTDSLLKKSWRITYYFRDPQRKDQFPYGKLVSIKGMNRLKTLEERRRAVKLLMEEEIYMLKVEGYNPITKKFNGPDINLDFEIDPDTPFVNAIEKAFNNITVSKTTRKDIGLIKKKFIKSIHLLKMDKLRIKDVRRKHARTVLEHQAINNGYSSNRFNKARAYMQIIFKELLISEAIEYNPIDNIPKKKVIKKIRKTLSIEELNTIKAHLFKNHYEFYRYMNIFFHSGCRNTELFHVKKHDVDLNNQQFKILVKKGKEFEEQLRAINNNVLHLWIEICKSAKKDDYIFSYNFSPGTTKIDAVQVSRKWKKHVKDKLKITADFYSLKHLHTTKVIDLYSRNLAAGINGHKDTEMNDRHYDTLHNRRVLERAKNIDISM